MPDLKEATTRQIIDELLARKIPFVFISKDIDDEVFENKNSYWLTRHMMPGDIAYLRTSLIKVLQNVDAQQYAVPPENGGG